MAREGGTALSAEGDHVEALMGVSFQTVSQLLSNVRTAAATHARAHHDAWFLKRIYVVVCWTGCGRMQNESFRSLVGAVTRLTNLLLVLEEIAEEREREGSIELTNIAVRGDV